MNRGLFDFNKLIGDIGSNIKIEPTCPVGVFNCTDINKNFNIGYYLILREFTVDELIDKLKHGVIMGGIKQQSILFFDKHHIYEILGILSGALTALATITIKNTAFNLYAYKIIVDIAKTISSPLTYEELLKLNNSIIDRLGEIDYIEHFSNILQWIYFIHYGYLDELFIEAQEFFDNYNEVIKNEGNDNFA